MPIPIIIALVLAVIYIAYQAVKVRRKEVPKVTSVPTTNPSGANPAGSTVTPTVAEKTPENKRKDIKKESKSLGFGWLTIIAIIGIGWFGYKYYSDGQTQEQVIQQRIAQEMAKQEVEKKPTERPWLYASEEPTGFDGQYNHTAENKAKLLEDSDTTLTFEMFYDNLGKTESVVFFLDRSKDEGVWTKQNPRMSGRWKLKSKKFQLIKGGYCITWNADRDPQTWYSAYFRPQ